MSDPVLTLEPTHVTVEPGGQARVVVGIANEGSIVEGYTVELVDEVSGGGGHGPARWYRVLPGEGVEGSSEAGQPGSASVLPHQRRDVVIVLAPDASQQVASGGFRYAVRVTSKVDGQERAAVEGAVEVGRVHGLQAKLIPVTSKGRWSGRHVVQVSNWGNAPARVRLVPTDPDLALGFLVRPEVVDVPLGGTATARLRVRTRAPSLRGQPARVPFSVRAEPDAPGSVTTPPIPHQLDPSRPVVDGAFAQRPILSRGVTTMALMALVACVAVTAFAFVQKDDRTKLLDDAQPPPPELSVEKVDASTLTLRWDRIDGATGYQVLRVDPKTHATQEEPPLGARTDSHDENDLKAATEYCFLLIALTPKASSPPSDPACATTDHAPAAGPGATSPVTTTPGSTTTTTGGTPNGSSTSSTDTTPPRPETFAATDWILVVITLPEDIPTPEAVALDKVELLSKVGITGAKVLSTRSYPNMKPGLVEESWLVYLGPFDSKETADTACRRPAPTGAPKDYFCTARQPDPAP